jgi:hypothetical protein
MALSQRLARVGHTIQGMKASIARKGNQKGKQEDGGHLQKKVVQDPRLLTMTIGYKSAYATFMNEECITTILRNREGTLRNQRNGDYRLHSPY